uniref:Eicosapentaenoic 8-lipoxygenase n=1 Tax=Euphausia pacifica TaxID=102976 RepID=A0A7G1H465_9EUCA|nr:eicosapentaenoic 8-lipoxygenase [Euphausia pacifica]
MVALRCFKPEKMHIFTICGLFLAAMEVSNAYLCNNNFLVTVKTGYGTDAGSNASVILVLEDQNRNEIRNWLSIPKQDETGNHTIPIPKRFGRIVTVKLALDYRHSSDWYCEDIFVEDPRLNDRLYFPIDRRIQGNLWYEFQNYATCLPQFDQNSISRRLTLQKKREDYQLSYDRTAAMVKDLPQDEIFHQDYISSIRAIQETSIDDQIPLLRAWQSSNNISAFFGGDFYMPQSIQFWKEDAWFGAQRVQGVVPNIIELCKQIPDKLGVTEDTISGLLEGSTLQQALKNNKIFISDLELLDGIQYSGVWSDNADHAAPISVFYLNKIDQLMPIAIQLRQQKGPKNPVYTPKDPPNTWLVAKIYYNNAESQFHQILVHFGYTHMIMDGIATSMNRQLSPSHPVFKILKPHFLYLLAINRLGEQELFVPQGVFPYFSIGLDGMNQLLAKAVPQFTLARAIGSVESDARARGVWDKQVLPYYPFRDDAHSMYNIIKKYATKVIYYYYNTPGKIINDMELQRWRTELAKPRAQGGVGIPDLPGSDTAGFRDINEIIDLVTTIITHSSVGHAAVNFPMYDTYGYFPNYPSDLNEGPPLQKMLYTEDEIMSLFPNESHAFRVRATIRVLSWQGTNDCGDFEKIYLYDPVSQEAQVELRKDLAMFSKQVMNRNSKRFIPYKYLDPNYVPNAISI